MTSTAQSYVIAYAYGVGAELYWWGRVTPFDQEAYYSAGFIVAQ